MLAAVFLLLLLDYSTRVNLCSVSMRVEYVQHLQRTVAT